MDIQLILNNNSRQQQQQPQPQQSITQEKNLIRLQNNNKNGLNSSFNGLNTIYVQSYNSQGSLVEDGYDETIINTIASLKDKTQTTTTTTTTTTIPQSNLLSPYNNNLHNSMQTTPISSPSKSPNINSVSPAISKVPNSYYNSNNGSIGNSITYLSSNNVFNNINNNNTLITTTSPQQHHNNHHEFNSEEESDYIDSSDREMEDEPSSPAMRVPNSPSVQYHDVNNTPVINSKVVKKTPSSSSSSSSSTNTSQQVAAAKKPRKSYEVYKKLEILDEKNKYGMNFVVKKYHISRSIISRWISNIDKYKSFNKKNLKKLHKGPKASFSMEQENLIIEKINQARQNGEVVSGETIKKFALELSKQLNNNTFKASSGWLENFKSRHQLNLTNRQQLPTIVNNNSLSNIVNHNNNNDNHFINEH